MATGGITPQEKAAWILHEALRHRYHAKYPDEPASLVIAKKSGGRQHRLKLFASLLLFLTVFEVPMWCDASDILRHRGAVERCTVQGGAPAHEVVMSGVPFLPVLVAVLVEFGLLGMVFRELLHQRELNKAFEGQDVELAEDLVPMCCTGVALVDACLFVVFPSSYGPYRMAPYIRFVLAVTSVEQLKRLTGNFIHCMFSVAQIGSFLLGSIVIFAWIAASLFDDVKGDDIYGDPINAGFEDFGNSLYTSFLTSTGANLPDALVNSVVTNRNYIWLWFPYILLTVCLFSQVVLAAVYSSFTAYATDRVKQQIMRRNKGLRQCWRLLMKDGNPATLSSGEKALTKEEFNVMCDVLNDFADPQLQFDMEVAPVMFEALDSDDSGQLAYKEFVNMCEMLEHSYHITTRDSTFIAQLPTLKAWCDNGKDGPDLGYADRFPGSKVDKIVNVLLALNSIFIVVESVYDLNDWKEPGYFRILDTFFSFVYLLEVAVKLLVWNWGEYWSSTDNRFDFVTSWILAWAGVALLRSKLTPDTLRNLNILRLLRLLKALNNIPIYQTTCELIGRMVMACVDVLLMNVLVLFLWSACGMQFYGGQLYPSNPLLKGSDYLDAHFEVYNFNDMGMSFITLFYFVLTGWVDEVATALIALTSPGSLGWLGTYGYLVSFFMIGFLLAFNIWTAFSIDVFCNLQDMANEGAREESDVNLDDVRSSLAEKNQCLHVGASASLLMSKISKAMFDIDDEGEGGADPGTESIAVSTAVGARLDATSSGMAAAQQALDKLDTRLRALEQSRL